MFLYVEGQLIQYFCFECTQSKSTMYIIKIHLPGLTVCMMLESQRWGWYLNTMRWQHSWQNVDRIEKCGKNRVEPWSLPLKGSTLKIHNNTLPVSLCLFKMEKEKESKRKRLERFGWTQLKWLHGCIFRWRISVFALGSSSWLFFCFSSSARSPGPDWDSGLLLLNTMLARFFCRIWPQMHPPCLPLLWLFFGLELVFVFDLWSSSVSMGAS